LSLSAFPGQVVAAQARTSALGRQWAESAPDKGKMMLPKRVCWPVLLAVLLVLTARADTVAGAAAPPVAAMVPNRIELLVGAHDALAARLDLIARARRSIDLQYYLYHDDSSGRLLAAALLAAADRGVQVRILLDDIHSGDEKLMRALDEHPGIEVRRYNPFRFRDLRPLEMVLAFGRVDRRMHNKQLTVDGRFSIVGGRNIGDEYFGVSTDVAFADLDVLVSGPAVPELDQVFDAYWASRHSKKLRALLPDSAHNHLAGLRRDLALFLDGPGAALRAAVAGSAYARKARRGGLLQQECPTTVVADGPDKPDGHHSSPVARALALRLRNAEHSVLLISAYFVPGDRGEEALEAALDHHVPVQIVTNSLASTDVSAVQAGYERYRRRLLEAGADLWEMKPVTPPRNRWHFAFKHGSRASLHTKAYIFDDRYLFIGSFNLDPRSAVLNTEMGLLFDCPAAAQTLHRGFVEALPDLAWHVRLRGDGRLQWEEESDTGAQPHGRDPGAGFWRRTEVWWLKLLPIESEL
jgi:putative cardiolipin synthase